MNHMNKLDAFIQHAVSSVPVSGTSLISSLYGDALSHRGGEIWLGSLAALAVTLAPFAIAAGLKISVGE